MILKNKPPLDLSDFTQDDLAASVFMTVDVQEEFARIDHPAKRGNRATEMISKKLATLCPEFNQQGLLVAHILWRDRLRSENDSDTEISWKTPSPIYKIDPEKDNSAIIYKDRDSAFQVNFYDHSIKAYLEQNPHIKTIFISGFNRNACVLKTMIDGVIGKTHRIILVSDLTTNGRFRGDNLDHMGKKGFKKAIESIEKGTTYGLDNKIKKYDASYVTSSALLKRLSQLSKRKLSHGKDKAPRL